MIDIREGGDKEYPPIPPSTDTHITSYTHMLTSSPLPLYIVTHMNLKKSILLVTVTASLESDVREALNGVSFLNVYPVTSTPPTCQLLTSSPGGLEAVLVLVALHGGLRGVYFGGEVTVRMARHYFGGNCRERI